VGANGALGAGAAPARRVARSAASAISSIEALAGSVGAAGAALWIAFRLRAERRGGQQQREGEYSAHGRILKSECTVDGGQ